MMMVQVLNVGKVLLSVVLLAICLLPCSGQTTLSPQDQSRARAFSLLNQALDITESIHDPMGKAMDLLMIAGPYAAFDKAKAAQMLNEADRLVRLAPEIGDNVSKNIAFLPLAMSWVAIGNKEKAEEILTQMLAEPEEILATQKSEEWATRAFDYQAQLLAGLAPIYVELGERSKVVQLLAQSRARLDKVSKNSFGRDHGLEAVAQAYAEIGELQQAFEVAQMIEPESAFIVWGKLARAYAQAGQVDKAREISRKAERIDRISTASLCISRKYLDKGQTEKAVLVLRAAIDPRKKLEPGARYELADAAVLLAEAGEYREALQVLGRINAPGYRVSALTSLARVFSRSGRTKQAEQLLSEADKRTTLSEKDLFNVRYRWEVADAYADIAAKQVSMRLLSEIQSFVLAHKHEMQSDDLLGNVAITYARMGMPDLALSSIHFINDPADKARMLVSLATIYLDNRATPNQWYCDLDR